MSMMDWLRGRRQPADDVEQQAPRAGRERVDPETGEITLEPSVRKVPRSERASPEATEDAPHVMNEGGEVHEVAGERTIPSVNRERSVQSRISNLLAVSTMVLLGGGFLVWYYSSQFAKQAEARTAAAKANEARTSGEMKVPPLGRLDPPTPQPAQGGVVPVSATDVLGPAPPPPQAVGTAPQGGQPAGPPPKTPQQLALERQLAEPVVKRGALFGGGTAAPQALGQAPQQAPNLAALLGMQGGGQGRAPGDPGGAQLAGMLQPTPTPAVEAQVLPNRRFLLPKSAFVDCTLETAIDSTYPGLVTCIGANDVYSADGKVVLLERGTKYVGETRGEVKQGQGRVFVLWNEARTPTGVVARLDSPGTDELGRTGLPGFVDTHFWDRFGAAILISVIDGSLQALAASQQQGGSGGATVQISPTGARDVMTEILKSTVAIPPTVVKNQGDRIQIVVARDVDFRPVYALRTSAQN